MQEGRLIAISDVHLDTWHTHPSGAAEDKSEAFLEFLAWVRYRSGCQHFAIVGDLLDVPQSDHSPILPRFRQVFLHLWGLMRAGIMVHWVVGNHDAGLMGLDVAMAQPPVELAYPAVSIRSGETEIWLEHGHAMDAWLWAYIQYRASRVAAVPPAEAMRHFCQEPCGEPPLIPATNFVYDTIYEAMQWRAMATGFTDDEKRLGILVMSQHLGDHFVDVSPDGRLPRLQAEIMADLEGFDLTIDDLKRGAPLPREALGLFATVGARYYSALPWRRAATCKLLELRHRHGKQVRGLIMGHIHEVDRYEWQSDGDQLVYANCGTWSDEGGSFVLVENGHITPYQRRWDDPLPEF